VTTLAVWIHPIAALLTTALALRGASLALRGRRLGPRGAPLLMRHRALMPWVLGLVVANFVGGIASAWLWRDPEDLAASGHHQMGMVVVGLFVLAAVVGLRIDRTPRLRAVHPWIGAAALLASGVQIFLGLQIIPLR
jgi:uncharacterized protein DUF4079